MATIDRRTALAGLAGLGSGLTLEATAAAVLPDTRAGSVPLGGWRQDSHALPCYDFTGDVPLQTVTPAGHAYPLEPDPVFLLGNYDLTLFVSASGLMHFISGERGWVRLNEPTGATPGNAATLTVRQHGATRTHDLLGLAGMCASGDRTNRTFGCGTARYRIALEHGLTVERILSVAPATATSRAEPAVILTVRMTNTGAAPLDLDHVETMLFNPTLATNHATESGVRPVTFRNSARSLPGGGGILCDAIATSPDPQVLTPIETPNRFNLFPPSLVLMAAPNAGGGALEFSQRAAEDGAVVVSARSRMRLAPGATQDIVLVIALQSPEADFAPLRNFAAALLPSPSGDWFREDWVKVLAPLDTVPDPPLRAELLWDAHALLAMATYAAYYRQAFIPQGMTYDYVMDLNCGPRDHLQHALGAACFAPELARSSILYTLCQMSPSGAIKFTVSGNGLTSNSSWSPSDQSIFLFQAVGEYLRITQDWSILEAATPFADSDEAPGSVFQKLQRAFAYLRDHVSTGPHGLVRLLTGDWNDQIYAGVPQHQYRDTAESHMNAAMVMAIVPPLTEQLDAYARTKPAGYAADMTRLAHDMRLYADGITQALMRDMEGRTFARRAWLAPGKALGEDAMFLEPQAFLLQARDFPVERKYELWREMQRRLIDREALGPRQRERPAADTRMVPGTSENGGFWYSLAGQAIAGVATFDRQAALALLDRMTFRSFARRYPDYWVGRWTAPDTFNATISGDFAGLPRPMDDGLYCRMATYCAHAHAWPIYAYSRIRDAR